MVVAHSFGENVFRNFLAWMERREPGWTELHVAIFFNIAGPVLGVPKVSCCLMCSYSLLYTLAHDMTLP